MPTEIVTIEPLWGYYFLPGPGDIDALVSLNASTATSIDEITVGSVTLVENTDYEITANLDTIGVKFLDAYLSSELTAVNDSITAVIKMDNDELLGFEMIVPVEGAGISLNTSAITIRAEEVRMVIATISPEDATISDVTWDTDNALVATVNEVVIPGLAPHIKVGTITGIANGTAEIEVETADGGHTDSMTVTVADAVAPPVYADVKILDKDFALITTIANDEIISLTITKELGGSQTVDFSLPIDAAGASEISTGRYIEVEGQRYYFERINRARDANDIPVLDVAATHLFFELENRRAGSSVARRDTIMAFLGELLEEYGATVSGIDATNKLYEVTRYIEYERGEYVMPIIRKIFTPWLATYRLDNLSLTVVPPDYASPLTSIELNYSENNQSIRRDANYANITTVLHAYGEIPEGQEEELYKVYNAPAPIRELYREDKVSTLKFAGVTTMSALDWVAEEYLSYRSLPEVTYELSVAELKNITDIATIYPGREWDINIGDRVTVYDAELGIDNTVAVMRYTYKPLEPDNCSTIVLGTLKPYDRAFEMPSAGSGVGSQLITVAVTAPEGMAGVKATVSLYVDDGGVRKLWRFNRTLPFTDDCMFPLVWVRVTSIDYRMPDGRDIVSRNFYGWSGDGYNGAPDGIHNTFKTFERVVPMHGSHRTVLLNSGPGGGCAPLAGIISTDNPDATLGVENCLWFKYEV